MGDAHRRVFDIFTDIKVVTDRPTANENESIVQFRGQCNANANAPSLPPRRNY
jgi:hypothetical protein